jgi:endonuclease YncB( thermonuclease family)
MEAAFYATIMNQLNQLNQRTPPGADRVYARLITDPPRSNPMTTWTVPALVTRVIDGDTIVANLDLGWSTWLIDRHIRLAGLNCPEHGTPDGDAATAYTTARLISLMPADGIGRPLAAQVTVVSHSVDKYGRVLGTVYYMPPGSSGGVIPPLAAQGCLNDDLLSSGHAVVMR